MESIQNFDFSVVNGIQDTIKCDFLDIIMPFISDLGNGVIWALLGLIFLFRKKLRFNGITIITALIITVLITEFLVKPIFMRERPYMLNPEHILLVSEPFGSSFPSGHTSTSFAAAVQFFGINKKTGIAALLFAALIGFSRLYLYVHFLTDVICGAILGTILGLLVMFTAKKIRQRFKEREEN